MQRKQPDIAQVIEQVANFYGINGIELTSPKRNAVACARRAVAYRLCEEFTDESHKVIGEAFGRDHTSVRRALERPLLMGDELALEMIRQGLQEAAGRSSWAIGMWPFKSRRKALAPVFRRRSA